MRNLNPTPALLQEPRSGVGTWRPDFRFWAGSCYLQLKIDRNPTLINALNNLKTSKNDGLLYLNDPLYYSIEPLSSSRSPEKLDSELAGRASGDAGKPQTLFSVKFHEIFFRVFSPGLALSGARADDSALFRSFWGRPESLNELDALRKISQHIPAAFSGNG